MYKAKTKKFLSALLCVIICISLSLTALAVSNDAAITVSSVSAMPGDTVVIDIEISNNPGIMAMAFCITYDNEALTYVNYEKGYLSSYTIKDHSDKGHISVVNVENKDKSNNDKIISVVFEVKEKAKPGKHVIAIANSNREKYGTKLHNSFSNSKQQFVVPLVTAGGVTVQETCENAGHKYGGWNIINAANCTQTGLKNRTCTRCQIVDEVTIPITHDFETEWTVDKVATPEEDGVMSRHCKNCDAVTDRITFTYEEVEDSQNPEDNTSSDDNSSIDDSVSSGDTSSNNTSSDVSSGDTSSNNTSSDVSGDENLSENNTSVEQSSQNSSPSDNTSSNTTSSNNNSSDNSSSNKTPINNTVGAKNPQSAVENIKDYQENIKPNVDNNTSSGEENTDTESDTVRDNTDTNTDTNTDSSKTVGTDDTDIDSNQSNLSAGDIALFVVSGVISIAIIVLAIILILKRKKQNEE